MHCFALSNVYKETEKTKQQVQSSDVPPNSSKHSKFGNTCPSIQDKQLITEYF